jgi:hypothetical protein
MGGEPHSPIEIPKLAAQISTELDITIEPRESPEERASRLRREEAQAEHERKKDFILFQVTLAVATLVLLTVVGFSLYCLATPTADAEAKKWAATALTSLITGVGGYLYGKSRSGKD